MTPKFVTLSTPTGPLILNTGRIEYVEEDEDGRTCVVMVGKDEMHVVGESVSQIHTLLRAATRIPEPPIT